MNFSYVAYVLRKLYLVYSLVLLPSLVIAVVKETEYVTAFVMGMLVPLGIALLFRFCAGQVSWQYSVKESVLVIALGWLSVCFFGAIPYLVSLPQVGVVTAVFESTSMWTTTGLTALPDLEDLPLSFQVWRIFGHWCGAVGIIVLFSTFLPKMTRGKEFILGSELPGRGTERTLPKIRDSIAVVILTFFAMTLVEFGLLLLGGLSVLDALNLTVATVGTGGLCFNSSGIMQFPSIYVAAVGLFFMLVGGTNFSLWFKLWRGDMQAVKEDPEHRYYLGLVLSGTAVVSMTLWMQNVYDVGDALHYGFMMVLSYTSTTGFAFADVGSWPEGVKLVLLVLLSVGGCSASAAGGFKIIRCVILGKALKGELIKNFNPHGVYVVKYGGKAVPTDVVASVVRFFLLYLLTSFVLVLAASFSGLNLMDCVSMVASCMSSTGSAWGCLGTGAGFAGAGCYIQGLAIVSMLLGRLEITTLLVLLSPDFWGKRKNW